MVLQEGTSDYYGWNVDMSNDGNSRCRCTTTPLEERKVVRTYTRLRMVQTGHF